MGLEKRVRRLEDEERTPATAAERETVSSHGEFWEMQLEWEALRLLRDLEPGFTLDGSGAFFTLDGRFAVSPERMDLRGLMGPRTEALQEAIEDAPERWGRFLETDHEAADLLDDIRALGEAAVVPEDYETPLRSEWTMEEVESRFSKSPHKPCALFEDTEEREATRRLTWALIHNPDARAMLSELTRRRDAFVEAEGLMPAHLPPTG
jgi:hypothetical protein